MLLLEGTSWEYQAHAAGRSKAAPLMQSVRRLRSMRVALQQFDRDDVLDRDLFVLELPSPADFPRELSLPSPRFACLIAWDARDASVDEIATIAQKLLESGAVYVCARVAPKLACGLEAHRRNGLPPWQ